MAIKIRKKVDQEKKVLEPEVLPPEGSSQAMPSQEDLESSVKIPEMNDNFLRTSGSVMQWILDHRRVVILGVAIIVLIAFGFVGVRNYQESEATARSSVLNDVFVSMQAMTKADADKLIRDNEAYIKTQISANEEDILRPHNVVPDDHVRYVAIEDYLKKSLPALSGETIEPAGKLMLAGVTANLHDDAAAAPLYDEVSAVTNADLSLFGQLGKVETLVGEQKYDEALKLLDQIMVKAANPKFSSYIIIEKARLYENMGRIEDAIQAYDAVLNQFNQPDDQAKAMARLRILVPDAASHLKPVEMPNVAPEQVSQ